MKHYCEDCQFLTEGHSGNYCNINSLIPTKKQYSGIDVDADGGALRKSLFKYLISHWEIDRDLLNEEGNCSFYQKKSWYKRKFAFLMIVIGVYIMLIFFIGIGLGVL